MYIYLTIYSFHFIALYFILIAKMFKTSMLNVQNLNKSYGHITAYEQFWQELLHLHKRANFNLQNLNDYQVKS